MYEKINNFDVDTKVTFVTGVLTNDSTRGGKGDTELVNQPVNDWTDEDWTTFRTVLKNELQSKTAEVTFTKLNGDVRVMTCTLNPELLPAKVVTEGEEEKPTRTIKNPNNSLPVYDINAEGWRSFVIKNVTPVLYKV